MRDLLSLFVFGPILLVLLYLALTGCALQIPIEVDSYMKEYVATEGLCEATKNTVTLEEWIEAACDYLEIQELVLGYIVTENGIHIRFASVKASTVVCFPCGLERE